MKCIQHDGNLVQLTRLPHVIPVNVYLVREHDGFTAIDTALPGSAGAILAAALKLDAPIVRIALTHAHMDHVGSLDALHARLPQAEVLMTARTARLLRGDKRLEPDEPQDKLRGSWKVCTTPPSRVIAAGDKVGSLEVMAGPGHTPDHIAFMDSRDGTLIVGDAFQTQGGVAVAGTLKLLFPLPALGTWHRPTALATAVSLRSLNPSRLAVGHGPVLLDPLHAMDLAIAEANRKVANPK